MQLSIDPRTPALAAVETTALFKDSTILTAVTPPVTVGGHRGLHIGGPKFHGGVVDVPPCRPRGECPSWPEEMEKVVCHLILMVFLLIYFSFKVPYNVSLCPIVW